MVSNTSIKMATNDKSESNGYRAGAVRGGDEDGDCGNGTRDVDGNENPDFFHNITSYVELLEEQLRKMRLGSAPEDHKEVKKSDTASEDRPEGKKTNVSDDSGTTPLEKTEEREKYERSRDVILVYLNEIREKAIPKEIKKEQKDATVTLVVKERFPEMDILLQNNITTEKQLAVLDSGEIILTELVHPKSKPDLHILIPREVWRSVLTKRDEINERYTQKHRTGEKVLMHIIGDIYICVYHGNTRIELARYDEQEKMLENSEASIRVIVQTWEKIIKFFQQADELIRA